MNVSIQGNKASFHHIVATKIWGDDVGLVERESFTKVFRDVTDCDVEYGLVAIENTLTGSITETLDLLTANEILICGEYILKVDQNLIVVPGATLSTLKTVHSHPVAIMQCLEYFKQFPEIKLIAADDTGGSVKQMMEDGDPTRGSIASAFAAEMYAAEILASNIQSDKNNFTRFLIISNCDQEPEAIYSSIAKFNKNAKNSERKVTLILHMEHKPGVLADCLSVIAHYQGNITRIESRPIKGKPWEYTMHIDMIVPSKEVLTSLSSDLQPFITKNETKGIYIPAILPEELELRNKIS